MNERLKVMLAEIKSKSFRPGVEVSDAHAMGIQVSRYFEWDGVEIMKTASLALEDANFHTESAMIDVMAKKASR